MSKLNIIGLGYIGLPTALMFAANGVDVVGTDLNEKLINTLNNNQITFEENGLEDLYKNAVSKKIVFQTEYEKTDKYIVTVPTPYMKDTKKIDSTYVEEATKKILEVCKTPCTLVIESTISPGTIDKCIRPLIKGSGFEIGVDIHLVHAPERIIPGNMIYELENNSRTIGADEKTIGEEVKSWYSSFCKGEIILTDIKTAEMSKVVENTFRDINIAFANELAKICQSENMDIYELIKIANNHPRVNILQPGPGVGGHCISVDPWFLVGDYPDIVHTILSARLVNDSMPIYVFDRIKKIMEEQGLNDFSKIGLYGLTYKENIDDIRESPAIQLLEVMGKYGVLNVKLYDPFIKENKFENQYQNFDNFIDDIDMVVVLVSHDHIKQNMKRLENKVVYDTKNIIIDCNKLYKL